MWRLAGSLVYEIRVGLRDGILHLHLPRLHLHLPRRLLLLTFDGFLSLLFALTARLAAEWQRSGYESGLVLSLGFEVGSLNRGRVHLDKRQVLGHNPCICKAPLWLLWLLWLL